MQKIAVLCVVGTVILAALAVAGFFWLNNYIYTEKQGDGGVEVQQEQPQTENEVMSEQSTVEIPTDWKTYQNTDLGIELSYPSDWTILHKATWKTLYIAPRDRINIIQQSLLDGIYAPSNIEIEKRSQDSIHKTMGCLRVDKAEPILVNDVSGTQYHETFLACGENESRLHILTVVNANNGYYHIHLNNVADEEVYNEVLSTVHFIERIDTSDWQTYRNDQYGFEFKYPTDWTFVPQEDFSDTSAKLFVGFRHPGNLLGHDISIIVRDLNQPLNEIYAPSTLEKSDSSITDGKILMIADTKSYYFQDIQGPWPFDKVYIPNKNALIEISAFHYKEDSSTQETKFRENFQEILPTFRFNTALTPGEVNSWKGLYGFGDLEQRSGILSMSEIRPGILFFQLDVNRGAPSYNMGYIEGEFTFSNGVASYETTEYHDLCRLTFELRDAKMIVSQTGQDFECGFGHAVYADGEYIKKDSEPKDIGPWYRKSKN